MARTIKKRHTETSRRLGHRIVSGSADGERKVLVLQRLERAAPDLALPRVEIQWTERELASLAGLASPSEASHPPEKLIRALRD